MNLKVHSLTRSLYERKYWSVMIRNTRATNKDCHNTLLQRTGQNEVPDIDLQPEGECQGGCKGTF